MICAQCAQQVGAGAHRCPTCDGDPLLDRRYRLDRLLASDSIGASYRATRLEDGALVRVRSCALHGSTGPAPSESVMAVREIEHPGVPRWLDDFVVGEGRLARRWLVHEHIRGPTLAEQLAAEPRHRLDERRTLALVHELAVALAYLHGRTPPLVHAGLTPATILLRADGGGACILDLGCASEVVSNGTSRALARSLAYSAPEQLHGSATAAADVWALGLIAVVALSGIEPDELRDAKQELHWRGRVIIDDAFSATLARMLEPDLRRRISAAELAKRVARLRSSQTEPFGPTRAGKRAELHPWTQPAAPARAVHHHANPRAKPLPPRSPSSSDRISANKQDAPIRRPEELSRELSQAHQAAVALEQQQRAQLAIARVLVVIIAAVIAGLATYITLALSR